MIDRLTGFYPPHHVRASIGAIVESALFEGRAGFQGAERAYKSAFHPSVLRDCSCHRLHVLRRVAEEFHWQSRLFKLSEALLFHLLAHLLDMILVIRACPKYDLDNNDGQSEHF